MQYVVPTIKINKIKDNDAGNSSGTSKSSDGSNNRDASNSRNNRLNSKGALQ